MMEENSFSLLLNMFVQGSYHVLMYLTQPVQQQQRQGKIILFLLQKQLHGPILAYGLFSPIKLFK